MRIVVMRVFHGSDGCGVPEYVGEVRSLKAWDALPLQSEPDFDGNDWLYVGAIIQRGKQIYELQRTPDADNKYTNPEKWTHRDPYGRD